MFFLLCDAPGYNTNDLSKDSTHTRVNKNGISYAVMAMTSGIVFMY
jgi:hypothetical protein